MLSEKENFLKVLHGECPEWVPTYSLIAVGGTDSPIVHMMPPFLADHRQYGKGGTDIWGVEFVPTDSTNGGTLPKPGRFILKDIRKWRDVIKVPDISGYDWENIAKKHIEDSKVNRETAAISFDLFNGFFQHLVSFMGFEEGMLALYDEPEECKALLSYLCDFYCTVGEKLIDYYKPDALSIKDDTATAKAPFMSVEMYREFFVPFYDRQAKLGRDRGLPILFHNCGKCQPLLEPLVEIGVTLWDPAQTSNDLEGIKKKYGNRLVIAGGWEAKGRLMESDVSDEEIEASVKDTIYKLAPGGGYCFSGGYYGLIGDEECARKTKVVQDAYLKYRASVYGN